MEVTKTNAEWDKIFSGLKSLGNLKGVKLAYAVSKNSDKMERQLKHLEGLVKPTEAFEAYEKKRVAIVEKYAEKDAEGNAMIENNMYKVDPELVKPEVEALDLEMPEALEERKAQLKEFEEGLGMDQTLEIHMVKLEDLPVDISVSQMNHIKFMLAE